MVAYDQSPHTHMRVFRLDLGGSSFQAAAAVFEEVRVAKSVEKPDRQGNLAENTRNWLQFYRNQFEKLRQKDPLSLHELGLTSPSTQVKALREGLPRAYQVYPTTYLSKPAARCPSEFYLYAHVDYKGRSFEPRAATELEGEEKQTVTAMLFGGGYNNPPAVLALPDHGIKTPADLDPSRHYVFEGSRSARNRSVFVAEGASLELIDDFNERERQFRTSTGAVSEYLKQAMTNELGDKFRKQIAPGEGFHVKSFLSSEREGGDPATFRISVLRDGKGAGNPAKTHVPLIIPPNPFFHTMDQKGEVTVLPDVKTQEGLALRRLIAAVPKIPSLADYSELRGFTQPQNQDGPGGPDSGVVPRLETLAGRTLLVYDRTKECKGSFSPPDAILLPVPVYQWLTDDNADKQAGRTPPPMPASVLKELQSGFGVGLVLGRLPPLPGRGPGT